MIIDVDAALKQLREKERLNKIVQQINKNSTYGMCIPTQTREELLFDIRTEVIITKNKNVKGYTDLKGCKGEVIGWTLNTPPNYLPKYYTYRVRIQGKQNKFTADGAFVFSKHYLEKQITTEGGNKMLLKGYKIVGVKFRENDTTYYFASYEKGLKVNDLVCVHTRFGFNVATVAAINVDAKEVQCDVTEQVVSKINTAAYDERVKQAERIQELEEMLDDKLKDAQKLAIFEMFSKNDKEFAKLLDEYKSLTENK